jgi:hypothetical protein
MMRLPTISTTRREGATKPGPPRCRPYFRFELAQPCRQSCIGGVTIRSSSPEVLSFRASHQKSCHFALETCSSEPTPEILEVAGFVCVCEITFAHLITPRSGFDGRSSITRTERPGSPAVTLSALALRSGMRVSQNGLLTGGNLFRFVFLVMTNTWAIGRAGRRAHVLAKTNCW